MKKNLNKLVVFSTLLAPALVLAEGNSWDAAVTSLQGLLGGVAAVGAVVISLAVAVVGVVFVKNLVKRSS